MKTYLVLVAVFCAGTEMCAAREGRQASSEPPPMPVLSCTAFPGSAEWKACFAKWNADVAAWKEQIASFSQQQTQSSPGDAEDGATSSMSLNGWRIRAKDCGVGSSNINGQLTLHVTMPSADEVKAEAVPSSENTKQWSGYKEGQLQSWIKVTPPGGVSIEDVQHTFADHVLNIMGPAGSGGSGGSSFSSSFSSSSGGGSTFISGGGSVFSNGKK